MELKLPSIISGRSDVVSLRREIEKIKDALIQKRVAKKKVGVSRKTPEKSEALSKLLEENDIRMSEKQLTDLDKQLEEVHRSSPAIRVAFASTPDQQSLSRVVAWFRDNAHPSTLVDIGVQPMIAGGIVVHTTKNRFDLSIRNAILANSKRLTEMITNAE